MKESSYQFVDTNILVYAHDKTAGRKHEIAKNLLKELWITRNGCLSTQVLQEFFVVITKKVKNPISFSEAFQIVSDLSTWKINVVDAADILEAIKISERYRISFWDSLIIRSSLNLNCEIIWSEDLNSGQYFDRVKVVNPFLTSDIDK